MAVTINTLGSYSRQIVINGETSATNIINAVNTCLTALGWTLYDSATSGSRGLLTTRVYSAANNDGPSPTTKYMIIRYDLQRQYWFISCCEAWNTTTKVATNESWYGGRQILLPLQYSNCTLYVFASARYACFMGVVLGESSPWQGVFEFERDSTTEDATAKSIPTYGWTSSLTIGEPYGNFSSTNATNSTNNGFIACGFAPPRTANGLTGAAAANNFTILTILGTYPPQKNQVGADWSSGGITQALNPHNGMLGSWANGQQYVWNTNNMLIGNMNLAGYTSDYVVGKIYGLKITGTLGAVLDTTVVPVDSNLFYSAGGTNTTHYLLGIHGGYSDKFGTGAGRMLGTASPVVTSYGTPWQSVLVSGRFIYFTTTTGFHKYDVTSQSFTFNILPAAQYYSVKFDGGNNLYVTGATANTVYRVNLTDDTYTTLSMTGSWSGLAVDDANLYVASRATGASLTIKRVALSTFTEAASYTVTSGTAANYVTHMSTGDYSGYLYTGMLSSQTGTQNSIARINTTDGSIIAFVPSYSASNVTTGAQPILFDGINLYFMVMPTGTFASYMIQIKLSNFQNQQINSAAPTQNTIYTTTGIETLGSCEPVPFAGLYLINYTVNASSYRTVLSDPRITGILFGGAGFAFDAAYNVYGQPCTDQCSLYNISTVRIIRYTGAFRNNNFLGSQSANILIAQ